MLVCSFDFFNIESKSLHGDYVYLLHYINSCQYFNPSLLHFTFLSLTNKNFFFFAFGDKFLFRLGVGEPHELILRAKIYFKLSRPSPISNTRLPSNSQSVHRSDAQKFYFYFLVHFHSYSVFRYFLIVMMSNKDLLLSLKRGVILLYYVKILMELLSSLVYILRPVTSLLFSWPHKICTFLEVYFYIIRGPYILESTLYATILTVIMLKFE